MLFAHGSGSSRHSPGNNYVARILRHGGMVTLLMDLLTSEEDKDGALSFDIPLLTRRLLAVTRWLKIKHQLQQLPIGYFGANTGAAAALEATAQLDNEIDAIVSRCNLFARGSTGHGRYNKFKPHHMPHAAVGRRA